LKKLDFAQSIGILANVGVIAGIVFLGVELQQNNALLAAQARVARHEMRSDDVNRIILNNPELRRTLAKGRSDEPLSADELTVFRTYYRQVWTNLQFIYIEYTNGLLEEADLPIAAWSQVFTYPRVNEYWELSKEVNFRPDFVQWMEEFVVNER
jgi:hypothetical protein